MHGGTITSGRFADLRRCAARTGSAGSARSRTRPRPASTAMLRPTSKALSSVMEMRPLLHVGERGSRGRASGSRRCVSSAALQRRGVGRGEIRRAHRVDELARGEARALLRCGASSGALRPAARGSFDSEQIGLAQVVEVRVLAPFVRREAAVGLVVDDASRCGRRAAPIQRRGCCSRYAACMAPAFFWIGRRAARTQQAHPALRHCVAGIARSPRAGRHRQTLRLASPGPILRRTSAPRQIPVKPTDTVVLFT